MEFVEVSPHCGYVESESGLICPKIGVVSGQKGTLYFDTGASLKQLHVLDALREENLLKNPASLVISHFHNDHIANFAYFSSCLVYGSKVTARYVRVDRLVGEKTIVDLGEIHPEIVPLPSSHAKGSLILYIPEEKVVYLGDGVYEAVGFDKPYYDRSLFYEMSQVLKPLKVDHYVFGHETLLNQDNDQGMADFLEKMAQKMKAAVGPRLYVDD